MKQGSPFGDKTLRLGIVAKPDDPQRARIARFVVDHMGKRAELLATPELCESFPNRSVTPTAIEEWKVDAVVTVGGDGTILWAQQQVDAPILGINFGELGFLTEIEPIELTDGLDRLLAGDFHIESRLKLATYLNKERIPDALNETVVKTPKPAKILRFSVNLGEEELYSVKADGIITATPTGSTSYAMSAGGPILDPRVEALVLVPLAPFKLASRPMVLAPQTDIRIRLKEREKDAVVVIDGQYETTMTKDDLLTIRASDRKAHFIRYRDHFYNRLRERLR